MIEVTKDGKGVKITFEGADSTTNVVIRAKKTKNSTTKFKSGVLQYRRKVQ